MKAKLSVLTLSIVALLALGLTVACTRTANDAEIATQVQAKLLADATVQNKQLNIQSNQGTVTLSGTVANDAEREAVAKDASLVDGVKRVVDNLTVSTPAAAAATPAPEPAKPAPQKKPSARVPSRHHMGTPERASSEPPIKSYDDTPPPAPAPAPVVAAAPIPPPAPVPPPIRDVTIPSGTNISIRTSEALSSQHSRVGDVFHGSLSAPLVVGENVVIPQGADVEGRVTDAKDAAHFSGGSLLALTLTSLTVNGKTYQINTDSWSKQGTTRGKNTAEKVGGGAVLGAIIGGIAGGGKGAAIGAGVGAGAGGTAQAVTRGQQVELPSESELHFRLGDELTVTPVGRLDRNANRQPMND